MKPFKWQYPCFIYSKDPYLLESPFPYIACVSRNTFLSNTRGNFEKTDRFVFDLERGEVYYSKKALENVKFIEDPERCSKIMNSHRNIFNNARSHIFECESGVLVPKSSMMEEIPTNTKNPDYKEISAYFEQFKGMIETALVNPLTDSAAAVILILLQLFIYSLLEEEC